MIQVGADVFYAKTMNVDLATARKGAKDYTYHMKVVNGIHTVRETYGTMSPPTEVSFELDKAFDFEWMG